MRMCIFGLYVSEDYMATSALGNSKTSGLSVVFDRPLIAAFIIAAVTLLCYLPSFSPTKEFTNWDDPLYVTNQTMIKSLSADSIQVMFDVDRPVASNYHPLTMLSLAANYAMSERSMWSYIFTNVGLHVCNAILVFIFVGQLFPKQRYIAFFAGLWFGIHPAHVESVAWISERKDVLYGFFFVLSLIAYVRYKSNGKAIYLAASFVAFVASCLSKAMAVPLPVVLLLIDYYQEKQFTLRQVLTKLPFFAVSLAIGLIALKTQSSTGAIAKEETFSVLNNTLYACWGYVNYVIMLFAPYKLSAFYPYPAFAKSYLPTQYYLAPVMLLVMLVLFYLLYRSSREHRGRLILGIGVYTSMLVLVLQFLSVGSAVMADRYTYLPSIGIFILFLSMPDFFPRIGGWLWKSLATLMTLYFLAVTWGQVRVWNDSGTLWTDVIKKTEAVTTKIDGATTVMINPYIIRTAILNRGLFYRDKRRVDEAIADLAMVKDAGTQIGPYFGLNPVSTMILGELYDNKNEFEKAAALYKEALTRILDIREGKKSRDALPSDSDFRSYCSAYIDVCMKIRRPEEIVPIITRALPFTGPVARLYAGRGAAHGLMGEHGKAIGDLRTSLNLDPSQKLVRTNLAYAFEFTNQPDSARKYRGNENQRK